MRKKIAPLHLIIGLDLVITGITLLLNRHYFFWPPSLPWIVDLENSETVGAIGLATGLVLIFLAINCLPIVYNLVVVPIASAYYALLGVAELTHAFCAMGSSPHLYVSGLSDLVLLAVTLVMAKESPTR